MEHRAPGERRYPLGRWSMPVAIGLLELERIGLLGDFRITARLLARHFASIRAPVADNDG